MGFLLKIILFGVAIYAVWKTFARWKGLYDKFVGKPQEPARSAPPPPPQPAAPRPSADAQVSARKVVIEDTRPVRRLRRLYFDRRGEMRPLRPPAGITAAGRAALVSGSAATLNVFRLTFPSNVVAYACRPCSRKGSARAHGHSRQDVGAGNDRRPLAGQRGSGRKPPRMPMRPSSATVAGAGVAESAETPFLGTCRCGRCSGNAECRRPAVVPAQRKPARNRSRKLRQYSLPGRRGSAAPGRRPRCLTGVGVAPILPHRKNGLKSRKDKAF